MRAVASQQEFGEFYSRQLVLRELGPAGQRRLSRSTAVIVGLGGLGSASALYLTLAGVGRLRLVDLDTVELNNLHRQVLYDRQDVRLPKVEAAERRLTAINPDVELEAVPENLTARNVEELLAGGDCVVDGLDNMATRYLLNRASVRNHVPLIFGGAIGLEGNISILKPPETACLECVMPGLSDNELPTCDVRGVLGATTGIIGALQAMEAIKLLADFGRPVTGRMLLVDFYQMKFLEMPLTRREDCPACSTSRPQLQLAEEKPTWLCGRNTVTVSPPRDMQINLEDAERTLSVHYPIIIRSRLALILQADGHELTLFNNGRVLIKDIESENEALQLSRKIIHHIQ